MTERLTPLKLKPDNKSSRALRQFLSFPFFSIITPFFDRLPVTRRVLYTVYTPIKNRSALPENDTKTDFHRPSRESIYVLSVHGVENIVPGMIIILPDTSFSFMYRVDYYWYGLLYE